jgi:hypothetical protein
MRQKKLTELIAIRLDQKSSQDLKLLSESMKKNQSEVIRGLIHQASGSPSYILSGNDQTNYSQSN